MYFWRRLSSNVLGLALIGLSALALTACSGSDSSGGSSGNGSGVSGGGGGNGGGNGGGGGGGSFSAEANRKLAITPQQINFDEVQIGETNTKRLTIQNTGDGKLKLKEVVVKEGGEGEDEDGQREFITGDNWKTSTTIKENESREYEITYRPLNAKEDNGYILIRSNATASDRQEIRVPLQPSPLEPRINTDAQVNFTSVEPGATRWRKFSVKNIGQVALKVRQAQLSANPTYQLKVPPKDDDTGNSGGDKDGDRGEDDGPTPDSDREPAEVLPKTLEPGESFDFRVWFSPEDNRAERATVTLFSNDPKNGQKEVKLIGNSGAPCLGLSHKEEINFGTSSTGEIATKTVTVQNCRPRSEEALKLEDISISNDGGNVFAVQKQSLPGDLANGNAYTLEDDNAVNFVVTFTPPKKQSYEGELTIKSNDPSRETKKVKLVGAGSDNECPEAVAKAKVKGSGRFKQGTINTLPLERIVFDGTDSNDTDGSISRYEWSIIDAPEDSNARLRPNSSAKKPELRVDLAGEYRIELVVYDDEDAASCGEERAIINLDVKPEDAIHVQLVWDTPSDNDENDAKGTDLDLHYQNRSNSTVWNQRPWDIYWENTTANWGSEQRNDDNPKLDIDDTDGQGPENVSHDKPVRGKSYAVGVYYYDDHGFGPSYATIRIYIDGKLEQEYKNKFLSGTFEFWKVALIEWQGDGSANIYKRDVKYTGFPSN